MHSNAGAPVLLTVATLANLLDTSGCTIHRLHAAGRLPSPVRLGGQPGWRRAEILAWISAGMPARPQWEQIRHSSKEGG